MSCFGTKGLSANVNKKMFVSPIFGMFYFKNRIDSKNSLSEYLVSKISKDKLDDVAERFLEKYCPEVLEKPKAALAQDVARKMDRSIREVDINKTNSTFGQIYFSDNMISRSYRKAGLSFSNISWQSENFS